MLEIAQRLGPSCTCYGLDPWTNANNRAREKVTNYETDNVTIIDGSAENIPIDAAAIDLIVSNLGVNNFTNPGKVLEECRRVLRPTGQIAITTNLNGHWETFYKIFKETLAASGAQELIAKVDEHEAHRGSVASIGQLFAANGFTVTKHVEESFTMRFLDGTAFLNHYFVKLGWLASWKELIPVEMQPAFFALLENNLNSYAQQNGGLTLKVPMAYIEAQRA